MFIKKNFVLIIFLSFAFSAYANTPKSTGKYKNWESFTAQTDKGKICFAQTIPTKRAPASIKREKSKLFVTFRPSESIKDEVSLNMRMLIMISKMRLQYPTTWRNLATYMVKS